MNEGREQYFTQMCRQEFEAEHVPAHDQAELYKIARNWLFEDISHHDSAVAVARAYKLGKGIPWRIQLPADRSKPKETRVTNTLEIVKPLDPIEKIIARSEGTPPFIEGLECQECGAFIALTSLCTSPAHGKPVIPQTCPECGARDKTVNPNL